MKTKRHALAAAMVAVVGTMGTMSNASAAVVADGSYNLVINTTPVGTFATTSGTFTYYQIGTDGAWNSSFTAGGSAPNNTSQGMTDNGISAATFGGTRGSSIGGDGWAGILGISVTGSSFTVNGVSSMSGTIDQTTGAMTLDPTGRLAAFSLLPGLYDMRWNVDDCGPTLSGSCTGNGNTLWSPFSTTSASTPAYGGPVTIHGAPVTANGDQNSDGITDYKAILVSGGQFGSDFGSAYGANYFEVWNIQLQSTTTPHSGFNVDAIQGTCCGDIVQYVNPVPIPAAAWLFGSGLLGLMGLAGRQKMRKAGQRS